MKNPLKMDEPLYGVVLTDGQGTYMVEKSANEAVFDCARRIFDCEWIEIVEPKCLADKGYTMLIDEEGKIKGDGLFVNCVASYLYGAQEHGDVIIGNAIIVKRDDEELKMLTGAEAMRLSREMMALRSEAVAEIASALQITPQPVPKRTPSVTEALRQPETKNRQPCMNDGKER